MPVVFTSQNSVMLPPPSTTLIAPLSDAAAEPSFSELPAFFAATSCSTLASPPVGVVTICLPVTVNVPASAHPEPSMCRAASSSPAPFEPVHNANVVLSCLAVNCASIPDNSSAIVSLQFAGSSSVHAKRRTKPSYAPNCPKNPWKSMLGQSNSAWAPPRVPASKAKPPVPVTNSAARGLSLMPVQNTTLLPPTQLSADADVAGIAPAASTASRLNRDSLKKRDMSINHLIRPDQLVPDGPRGLVAGAGHSSHFVRLE